MKVILSIIILLTLFLFLVPRVYATSNSASEYVLPYPGVMPGNKLYKVYELFDLAKKYYSFGDFAQFKYNLAQSDKYLVEAKTLFEYKQYPLALKSLDRSNNHFKKIYPSLISASKNGKNITEKKRLYGEAILKHLEVLRSITPTLPEVFIWQDEKKPPVTLSIRRALENSIRLRDEK